MTYLTASQLKTVALSSVMLAGLSSTAFAQAAAPDAIALSSEALSARSDRLWWPEAPSKTAFIDVCFKNGTVLEREAIRTIVESGWEAIPQSLAWDEFTAEWNPIYGVNFRGWSDCPADPIGSWISIELGVPGLPVPGRVNGLGRRALNSDPSMEFDSNTPSIRTVLHEFGHVLGFSHEFLRSDFASVDPTCAATGGTAADIALTGPDTSSIMNYLSCGAGTALDAEDREGFSRVYGPYLLQYGDQVAARINEQIADLAGTGATVWTLESLHGESGLVKSGDAVILAVGGSPVLAGTITSTYPSGQLLPKGFPVGVSDTLAFQISYPGFVPTPVPVQLVNVNGLLE
jgi:hypothetical protein